MDLQTQIQHIKALKKIEIRILYYLCQGFESKDLAEREDLGFHIGNKAIESHLTDIFKKLEITGAKKEETFKRDYCEAFRQVVPTLEVVDYWIPVPLPSKPASPTAQTPPPSPTPVQEAVEQPPSEPPPQEPPTTPPNQPNIPESNQPEWRVAELPWQERIIEAIRRAAHDPRNQYIAAGVILFVAVIVIAALFGRFAPPPLPIPVASGTTTFTPTSLPVIVPTAIVIPTETSTAPLIPTETPLPLPTPSSTLTPLPTVTPSPTLSPTFTEIPPTPTSTPSPTVTFTPSPTLRVIFRDDFNTPPNGYSDKWQVLGMPTNRPGNKPFVSPSGLTSLDNYGVWMAVEIPIKDNYRIDTRINLLTCGQYGIVIAPAFQDPGNYQGFNIGCGQYSWKVDANYYLNISPGTEGTWGAGETDLSITVKNNAMTVSLNGTELPPIFNQTGFPLNKIGLHADKDQFIEYFQVVQLP